MSNANRFIKSSAVYFVGNVLTKVISFVLLPMFTIYISTEDMGYYDLSVSYLNILVPVIGMEVWSAFLRYMFDFENKEDKYRVIFNGMVIFSGSTVVYCLLFAVLGIVTDVRCLFLIFFYGWFTILQNIYSFVARGLGFNTTFAVSGIISSLVNSVSNIVMVIGLNMRLESLYIAYILGHIAQILILESKVKIFRHLSFKLLDKQLLVSMLKYSLPLSLNSAAFWFLSSYNKVGVANILGLENNGIYSVAGKFTAALTLISTCFSMAWQELVYSKGNETDKSDFYTSASNYYIKFLMVGLLLLVPVVQVVFPFMVVGEGYKSAFEFIPLYLLATVASIYSNFLGNIFGAEKKTGVIMFSTLVAAVVNVAVLHLLIGTMGVQAANISLLCGFIVNIVVRIVLLNKTAKIRLDYKFIILSVLLFAGATVIYLKNNIWLNLAFAALVLIFGIFVFRPFIRSGLKIVKSKLGKAKE